MTKLDPRRHRGFLVFAVLVMVVIGLLSTPSDPTGGNGSGGRSPAIGGKSEQYSSTGARFATIGGIALVAPTSLSGSVPAEISSRGSQIGLLTYIVKEGDTLSTIAVEFGVSLNTILWENDLTSRSILKPGMKLLILPVDGIKHIVKRGDTVSGIAARHKADIETILTYNILDTDEVLTIGDLLIVPDGIPYTTALSRSAPVAPTRSLIDVSGYFTMPVAGHRTQGLHRYNAIDLGGSNYCNTPVRAAAEGTVTSVRSGWNGGYGKYVKISHPNGTVTLYAHNSQNLVSVGEAVSQGQTIALMGSTGNSTGCHVHFEVRGARNPFSS